MTVLKNFSHRGLWKRNTLHGRFWLRDRAETADAQQKSWDLRSSIWTSLKKERRGQHKGHFFDGKITSRGRRLLFWSSLALANFNYSFDAKTELRNQKPGTVLNSIWQKDSPFLDVPINWSNIARICSDADILVLM